MKTDILITGCDYEELVKAKALKEAILRSAKAFKLDNRHFLGFSVDEELMKALFPIDYELAMIRAVEKLNAAGKENENN